MLIKSQKIFKALKNMQLSFIIILVITLPYFIAPSFTLLMSVLIFITTMLTNSISINTLLKEKSIFFLFLFIIFTYMSVLWAPTDNIFSGNFKVNINTYLNFFFLIPAIYFSNLSTKKIKLIFILIIASPIIYVIVYFLNHLNLTHIYSYHYDRVNGNYHLYVDLFANIFLVISSSFLYIMLLHFIFTKNYKKTFFLLMLFLLFFISLFIDDITVSRLTNITCITAILFISICMFPKKLKLPITVLILFLSISYFSITKTYIKGLNEIQNVYYESQFNGSWGHRLILAKYGLKMWSENPYIGRGIVDIIDKMILIKKNNPSDFKDGTVHFHNQHILILVQTGLVGYIIFLLFIYNLYIVKIKNHIISIYKNTTIIIFCVLMLGEHYLQMVHTSTLFALLIGLFLLYKKQETSSILK